MCTLTRLHLWYKQRKTDEDDHSPLIVVIPDVESFGSKILNDFFENLRLVPARCCHLTVYSTPRTNANHFVHPRSIYKDRIPFIVILGVATDLNALHQRVSHPVLQKFEVVIFKARPSLEFLDQVLEEVRIVRSSTTNSRRWLKILLITGILDGKLSVSNSRKNTRLLDRNVYVL
jgi:hypothetical protein